MKDFNQKIQLYSFSFLASIITYGFALTNFTLMADSETPISPTHFLEHGRWGANIIRFHVFGGILPYFTLLIGLFFLSLSAVIISRVLNFKSIFAYIFVMLFVSFPQHAYQLAFTIQADAIGIGFFLGATSVFLFLNQSSRKVIGVLKYVGVIVLLTLAISIYQALVFIPILIYALYFYKRLSSQDFNLNIDGKKLLLYVLLLLISIGLYMLVLNVFFLSQMGDYISSYAEGQSNGQIQMFLNLWKKNLLGDFYYGSKPFFVAVILGLIGLFVGSKKHLLLKIPVFLFLLLAPFIISSLIKNGYHPPRLYMSSTIVFAFFITDLLNQIRKRQGLIFVGTLLFFWNVFFTTQLFYSANRIYRHDLKLANEIAYYIKHNISDFDRENDYVYFYGSPPKMNYDKMTLPKSEIFGKGILSWDGGDNVRISRFLRFNDIADYKLLEDEDVFNSIKDSVWSMPVFPNKGGIEKINNVVIVKLGSTEGALLPFQKEKIQKHIPKKKVFNLSNLEMEPVKGSDFLGGIDVFEEKGGEVTIQGWAVMKRVPSINTDISLILFGEGNYFLLETGTKLRFDITDYINDGTLYNESGFYTTLDFNKIPKGNYDIGIFIKDKKLGQISYRFDKKIVVR